MSALAATITVHMRPMEERDVAAVYAIEKAAYEFPWTKGVFADCVRAGYPTWVMEYDGELCAYSIMTVSAGEAHLLNLCVKPGHHRRGFGRALLDQMIALARQKNAEVLFLEVRPSNHAAHQLYRTVGFNEIGTRPDYYPAQHGREDAVVLALQLKG
ncbi:MAG: ribosomal protein S18-alanine N-acetyltransferase, partial [Pseudomonadota bacterium]